MCPRRLTCKRYGYFGELTNGFRHGSGELRLPGGASYVGEWAFDTIQGDGVWMFADGRQYSGQWREGKMHGRGNLTVPGGARYDGDWQSGFFHDWGSLEYGDGASYEGQWRKGRKHGSGTLKTADGKVCVGRFIKGDVHGRSELTYPGGRKRYVGQFRASKPHGFGELTYEDDTKYVGQWEYGAPAGKGHWRDETGKWISRTPGDTTMLPTPLSSARGPSAGAVGLPATPAPSAVESEAGGTVYSVAAAATISEVSDQDGNADDTDTAVDPAGEAADKERTDLNSFNGDLEECSAVAGRVAQTTSERARRFNALDAELSELCSMPEHAPIQAK